MAGLVDFKGPLLYPWTSKMRVQGDFQSRPSLGNKTGRMNKFLRPLGVLALSLGLLSSTSCARRLVLTPGEFERIDKQEQATEALRVYVSKRLIVVYEADSRNAEYQVDRTINTTQDRQLLRVLSSRATRWARSSTPRIATARRSCG